MMTSSQRLATVRENSEEMYLNQEHPNSEQLSIGEDLLTDVNIDFGQEEEDSVFDLSLMQYLDQLPIAPPPPAATYSASFIEMVLQDIKDFKEDNQHVLNYEFDFNKSASDLPLEKEKEEEEEHAVEHSRRYQEYFNENEVPIQLTGMKDEIFKFAFTYKLSSSEFPLGYNNLVDPAIYQEQDELFNFEQEQDEQPMFDQDQYSFNDLLHEDDDSKDFSSWLCYDMNNENETVYFKVFTSIEINFTHTKYFVYKRRTLTILKSYPEIKMKTRINTKMNTKMNIQMSITKTKKRSITIHLPNILLSAQNLKIKTTTMKMHNTIKIENIKTLMLNLLI